MEKKLTAQGPKDRKSYTITLPIEWVKQNKLDKKKSVNLSLVGQTAVISPGTSSEKQITINTHDAKNSIRKIIQSCYRMGIKTIVIKYDEPATIQKIRSIIDQKLIGFEVVDQKKGCLTIKEIASSSGEDFKTIFRRIFLLIIEMTNTDQIDEASSYKKSIDKFTNYCQRSLILSGQQDFEKIPSYFLMLDRFEKISDEIEWMILLKNKMSPELQKILKSCYDLNFSFNEEDFEKLVGKTFIERNNAKQNLKTTQQMHEHNIYRLLNSLLGDIANINIYDKFKN